LVVAFGGVALAASAGFFSLAFHTHWRLIHHFARGHSHRFVLENAFLVIRAKSNIDCRWDTSRPVDRATGLRASMSAQGMHPQAVYRSWLVPPTQSLASECLVVFKHESKDVGRIKAARQQLQQVWTGL
jgi:hypothetical protein